MLLHIDEVWSDTACIVLLTMNCSVLYCTRPESNSVSYLILITMNPSVWESFYKKILNQELFEGDDSS